MKGIKVSFNKLLLLLLLSPTITTEAQVILQKFEITDGWQLQDIAKVRESGENISSADYNTFPTNAPANKATDLPQLKFGDSLSSVYLVRLELLDAKGKLISDNFYWKGKSAQPENLQQLDQLAVADLNFEVKQHREGEKWLLDVSIQNNTAIPALMAHLQLRKGKSQQRDLPVFYSDNYFSLLPGESKHLTIEASVKDLAGEEPLILVEGWNIGVKKEIPTGLVPVKLNENAQVSLWPATGLPFSPFHEGD
jgi:hypothetical protein